jgi:2-polyprenyl-3-methyl-5-hydroxy-6-metoxy-1,4-benzoquinol methylase
MLGRFNRLQTGSERAVAFQLCSFDSQRLNMIVNNVRKVLDLGAGHGRDSILFASNGIEVEALDYSAIAV